MTKKPTRDVFDNPKAPIFLLVLSGFIILMGAFFMWRTFVHVTPERTFWGMVESNLQTNGVTRHISQDNQAGSLDQYTQIEFGAKQIALGRTTVKQLDNDGQETNVVSEAISTPSKSYVRYVDIQTAVNQDKNKPDFSGVIGIWGEELPGADSRAQNSYTEVVFGVFPFADLTNQQRSELMTYIKENNVYEVSLDDIRRTADNGRTIYEFPVRVNMAGYVGMLVELDKMLGLNQLEGLDPEQYQDTPPNEITAKVDIRSRQLRNIKYAQGDYGESFSAYGAKLDIQPPVETISRPELEEKLQKILQ